MKYFKPNKINIKVTFLTIILAGFLTNCNSSEPDIIVGRWIDPMPFVEMFKNRQLQNIGKITVSSFDFEPDSSCRYSIISLDKKANKIIGTGSYKKIAPKQYRIILEPVNDQISFTKIDEEITLFPKNSEVFAFQLEVQTENVPDSKLKDFAKINGQEVLPAIEPWLFEEHLKKEK